MTSDIRKILDHLNNLGEARGFYSGDDMDAYSAQFDDDYEPPKGWESDVDWSAYTAELPLGSVEEFSKIITGMINGDEGGDVNDMYEAILHDLRSYPNADEMAKQVLASHTIVLRGDNQWAIKGYPLDNSNSWYDWYAPDFGPKAEEIMGQLRDKALADYREDSAEDAQIARDNERAHPYMR